MFFVREDCRDLGKSIYMLKWEENIVIIMIEFLLVFRL